MTRRLRWLGMAVAFLAMAYFVFYARSALKGQDLSPLLRWDVVLAGLLLVVLYAVLVPLTALAWTWLLRGLGQASTFPSAAAVLATTQFGKYLPGNVAHHIGRVGVAKAHGLATGPTILSMAYETLLVLLACAHLSALTFLWAPPAGLASSELAEWRAPLVVIISLGAVVGMAIGPKFARMLARRRSGGNETAALLGRHPGWGTSLACYLVYILNFVLVGVGLWVVARSLSDNGLGASALILLIGAFASSWILGFAAPGAPAGLGVREAVLSLWLAGSLGPSIAISLIVMLRIATTLGDLFNFLWGSVALARRRHGT